MGKSTIEWTERTWNPVRGCTRISDGCRNCYAETMAGRIVAMGRGKPTKYDGLVTHKLRVISDDDQRSEARWTGAVAFDPAVLAEPLKRRKPTTYFVNSMSDLFHDRFTNEQIAAVFAVMAACQRHTFILLTKRDERMRKWFEWLDKAAGGLRWSRMTEAIRGLPTYRPTLERMVTSSMDEQDGRMAWPLPNVILGVSVENQATADERIPHLLATPAAVRMVSAEPLLGPLDLRGWGDHAPAAESNAPEKWADFHWPDWVPAKQRESIEGFWSEANGRGPVDWLRDHRIQRVPATGARVTCSVDRSGWATINKMTTAGVSGRYLHAWNNIGRIITDDGQTIYASGGSGSGWLSKWLDGDGQYRSKLHWVIAGCESGPNARPCEVDWLRSLRDQCVEASVPFFLKQAVGTVHESDDTRGLGAIEMGPGSTRKLGGIISLPYLDGVQWTQVQEALR